MINKLSTTSPIRSGSYIRTRTYFFEASKLLAAQITEIFDQVWPTITALKNLRWQVRGYCDECNIQDNSRLSEKFVEKEDKINRPNLYRTCIEQNWDEQEFYVAKNLLINLFACYEAWCEDMLSIIGKTNETKNLQFPENIESFVANLQRNNQSALSNAFYEVYKEKAKLYHYEQIRNYLTIYRYFKECRNSMIHSSGVVSDKMHIAYTATLNLSAEDLNVKEKPQIIAANVGDPIKVSLRGVVGFAQIILHIISSLDVEFIKTDIAHNYMIQKMKAKYPNPYPTDLLANKEKQVCKIIKGCYFNRPDYNDELYSYLKTNNIMR